MGGGTWCSFNWLNVHLIRIKGSKISLVSTPLMRDDIWQNRQFEEALLKNSCHNDIVYIKNIHTSFVISKSLLRDYPGFNLGINTIKCPYSTVALSINTIRWYYSTISWSINTLKCHYSTVVLSCTSWHYSDVIMGAMASQITSLMIVYSTVYSGADQRKHQNSTSLAFVRRIHRWPVNSLHKWPVTRKKFPFDDVIMFTDDIIQYEFFPWGI